MLQTHPYVIVCVCVCVCVCSGPENPWLVQAYVHAVKHPFASVVGQEVFQSGIIPSDTDFRIFRDFGNIPGILTHENTHIHAVCNQFYMEKKQQQIDR